MALSVSTFPTIRQTREEKDLREKQNKGGVNLKPWQNKSGCNDPTAFSGEKKITEEEQIVADLVWIFKKIARWAGFDLINRVEFRHRVSGRTYR